MGWGRGLDEGGGGGGGGEQIKLGSHGAAVVVRSDVTRWFLQLIAKDLTSLYLPCAPPRSLDSSSLTRHSPRLKVSLCGTSSVKNSVCASVCVCMCVCVCLCFFRGCVKVKLSISQGFGGV